MNSARVLAAVTAATLLGACGQCHPTADFRPTLVSGGRAGDGLASSTAILPTTVGDVHLSVSGTAVDGSATEPARRLNIYLPSFAPPARLAADNVTYRSCAESIDRAAAIHFYGSVSAYAAIPAKIECLHVRIPGLIASDNVIPLGEIRFEVVNRSRVCALPFGG